MGAMSIVGALDREGEEVHLLHSPLHVLARARGHRDDPQGRLGEVSMMQSHGCVHGEERRAGVADRCDNLRRVAC